MLFGIHLTLLVGLGIPVPAPPRILESIRQIRIERTIESTTFQIVMSVGRDKSNILDYPIVNNPLLSEFNRLVIIVTLGLRPKVLLDGIITHVQFDPSSDAGRSSFTVTGEDLTVMLDREDATEPHEACNLQAIYYKILSRPKYGRFKITPLPITRPTNPPSPLERTPVQCKTDLAYIRTLARRQDFIFNIRPGPVPLTNIAYVGPAYDQKLKALPQKPLSFNMGVKTTVTEALNFQYNPLKPSLQEGYFLDVDKHAFIPLQTLKSAKMQLSMKPALEKNILNSRKRHFVNRSSVSLPDTLIQIQAQTERTTDVLRCTGELDTLKYGDILMQQRFVDVRGAGNEHNGTYFVESVTDEIIPRSGYKQRFSLVRDGKYTNIPAVIES